MADEIIKIACYKCRGAIYMPASVNDYLRTSRADFHCLNGHSQAYTGQPSEADKLRKELDATRITKRAKAGVCPCCNRTFKALAAHMATKHPTFTPIEIHEGEPATIQ